MAGTRLTIPSYQQVFGQDESDDELEHDVKHRRSGDLGHYDQDVRDAEEGGENLMAGQRRNPWQEDGSYSPGAAQPSTAMKPGRPKRNTRFDSDEKAGLVHESSAPPRYSTSGDSLDDLEQEKVDYVPPRQPSRIARIFKRYALPLSLTVLFIVIAYGAYQASQNRYTPPQTTDITNQTESPTELLHDDDSSDSQHTQVELAKTGFAIGEQYRSNGTALFKPTTILISLDGFRADFLQRELTPTLNYFISQGVSPRYMTPSFPSVTFPNHFTMVTGLYPESHGVVGNTFWDPELQEEFSYHDPIHSMDAKWWDGEPVWLTAERQGVHVATHMWPGSEAHIGEVDATYVDTFNSTEVLNRKVDRVFELIDKPGMEDASAEDQRPQLVLAYVPNVDADGHKYGPNSTHIMDTIRAVDNMLASILAGLQERNLTDIVNVVVVSDHGMATTSVDRLVQLDDLVDLDTIEHIDGWPHYGLRPKSQDPEVLEMLYNRLLTQTATHDGFDVYLRDKTMPERYHFSNNERIAPLWLIAKTGWAIVKKPEFDVEDALMNGDTYHPRGIHGYDHEHPLMRAIFVARGPAFPHQPNSRIEEFQNIEVYNIICDSVGVTPVSNNGTLRLPFQTVGLHSDFDDYVESADISADPPVTAFIPQISTIWDELSHATVASDDLSFISATPTSTATIAEEESFFGTPATQTMDGVYSTPTGEVFNDDYYTDGQPKEDEGVEFDDYGYEGTATEDGDSTPTATGDGFFGPESTTTSEMNDAEMNSESEEEEQESSSEGDYFEEGFGDETSSQEDEESEDFLDVDEDKNIAEAETEIDNTDDHYNNDGDRENEVVDADSSDSQFAHGNEEQPLDFEPTRPVMEDAETSEEEDGEEEEEEGNRGWFEWFGDAIGDVKDWMSGLIGGGSGDA